MRRARLAALILAAACDHGDGYLAAPPPANTPIAVGAATHLTFNPEGDWSPVWVPGGDRIGFTWREPGLADRDRCVAVLSLARLQIERRLCPGGPGSGDSMNAVDAAAFSAGGQVAFVATEGRVQTFYAYRFVMVGPADGSGPYRSVFQFPRVMPNGRQHVTAMDPSWVGESTLVWIGADMRYETGGAEPSDTTELPLEIVTLALTPTGGTAAVVPGTSGATAMAVDPATSVVYAAFGDSLVYAVDLATGTRTPVASFDSLGAPREISVAGGRVVGVVGGVSLDSHIRGDLVTVSLAGGPATRIPGIGRWLFRRPAVAPGGGRVVAEAFPYVLVPQLPPAGGQDTIVSRASDLFLFTVP